MRSIGNVLGNQSRYAEALEWYGKALKTRFDKLGLDHLDMAKTKVPSESACTP